MASTMLIFQWIDRVRSFSTSAQLNGCHAIWGLCVWTGSVKESGIFILLSSDHVVCRYFRVCMEGSCAILFPEFCYFIFLPLLLNHFWDVSYSLNIQTSHCKSAIVNRQTTVTKDLPVIAGKLARSSSVVSLFQSKWESYWMFLLFQFCKYNKLLYFISFIIWKKQSLAFTGDNICYCMLRWSLIFRPWSIDLCPKMNKSFIYHLFTV